MNMERPDDGDELKMKCRHEDEAAHMTDNMAETTMMTGRDEKKKNSGSQHDHVHNWNDQQHGGNDHDDRKRREEKEDSFGDHEG
jgi:hypothetical protein